MAAEKKDSRHLARAAAVVVWLLVVELAFIWRYGSLVAWRSADTVALQVSSILGGLALYATGVLSLPGRWDGAAANWRGVLLLAACWLNWPLFKAIRAGWIEHAADASLLALERALWGGPSLPEYAVALERAWLSELLSACYLAFYLVVLATVIWFAIQRTQREAVIFFLGLHLMYLLGFAGYVLVPAGGPWLAFPATFAAPVHGGAITHLLTGVMTLGSTGMDAFPSLHGGVAVYLWGFFLLGGRRYRAAAAVLTPLLLGSVTAAVYLRYHYGIDLLAGVALALVVLAIVELFRARASKCAAVN